MPAQSEVEGGQLKIVNATKQDAGWYKCEATNSIGSDKSETNVEVIEFVKPPEVINATEGADKQVKCRVTAMLTQQTVKWSKSMRELPALSDGTLKLTNIRKRADAGTYTCTVLVGKLKFVAKFQLNILGKYRGCRLRSHRETSKNHIMKVSPISQSMSDTKYTKHKIYMRSYILAINSVNIPSLLYGRDAHLRLKKIKRWRSLKNQIDLWTNS